MKIIGLWVAIVGYTIVYAGLANWSGQNVSLPDAFMGKVSTSPPTPGNPPAGSVPPPPNTPQTVPPQSMAGWNGNMPSSTLGAQPF